MSIDKYELLESTVQAAESYYHMHKACVKKREEASEEKAVFLNLRGGLKLCTVCDDNVFFGVQKNYRGLTLIARFDSSDWSKAALNCSDPLVTYRESL